MDVEFVPKYRTDVQGRRDSDHDLMVIEEEADLVSMNAIEEADRNPAKGEVGKGGRRVKCDRIKLGEKLRISEFLQQSETGLQS